MLNEGILERRLRKAQDILNHSDNLNDINVDARSVYYQRHQYFMDLVGTEGYMTFHPYVTPNDVVEQFIDALKADVQSLLEKRDMFMLVDSDKEEHDSKMLQLAYALRDMGTLQLAYALRDTITLDDLIDNKVPSDMDNVFQSMGFNFTSPKLCKL